MISSLTRSQGLPSHSLWWWKVRGGGNWGCYSHDTIYWFSVVQPYRHAKVSLHEFAVHPCTWLTVACCNATFFIFTAISRCQTVFPDFTPTGYIRDNPECLSGNVQCNAIYRNYTKPNCTGCPIIQLEECPGRQIVNCNTSKSTEYAEAAFQSNTAQPPYPDPCTIVVAESATCIQAAVKKVRQLRNTSEHSNLQISIRGGRHSYIGASTVSKGYIYQRVGRLSM